MAFYGLDVYSLYRSMGEVISSLRHGPDVAGEAQSPQPALVCRSEVEQIADVADLVRGELERLEVVEAVGQPGAHEEPALGRQLACEQAERRRPSHTAT